MFCFCHKHGRKRLKILRVMKLCFVLMTVFCMSVAAKSFSQQQKISLDMREVKVIKLFKEIQKRADLYFIYNSEDINKLGKVSVEVKDKTVEFVLNHILADSDLKYTFEDNVIIISPSEKKKQVMKAEKIKGVVVDNKGNPLPGVSVVIKGTQTGVSTDIDGKFHLEVTSAKDIVLVFSFVGMKTQEVKYLGKELKVVLQDDTEKLEEVVVTGIFNKPRESFTGSVSTITKDEIMVYKGQNVLQTIRNIDPSIYIALDNAAGSDPNHMPNVSIRGNSSLPTSLEELNSETQQQLNQPLIIMDGFEISLRKLMDFNDEEIESINILKDASATAIYGSRGANGVIVIKTKDPQAGKLKFYLRAGLDIEIPDLSSYDLMNAKEKLELERLAGLYESDSPTEDLQFKNQYNSILKDVLAGVDTYWLDEPVRTGVGEQVNLRIEGGSQEFRWSASLNNRQTLGVMKGSERKMTDASITLQYKYKNILFRNQASYSVTNAANSKYGNFSSYANMNPYWRLRDENGDIYPYYTTGGKYRDEYDNPLWNARLNIVDKKRMQQIRNNFSIEYTNKGFSARVRLGVSRNDDTSDKFLPHNHTKFRKYDQSGDNLRKGSYAFSTGSNEMLDLSTTISYSKTFADKHQVYVGFDYSLADTEGNTYYIDVEGFSNEFMTDFGNAIQYKENGKPSSSNVITRRVGFTGNFNYTYDNKYYIDGSYRVDGSSQFGSKKRFAPFWSVGAGWNINREGFLIDSEVISKLRLKMSYGQSGSQQFSAFQALSTLRYYTNDMYLNWNGANLLGLGNENLKWQTTDQANIGLESSFFNNKMNAAIDFYVKETSNLLSAMDLPYANGFNSYTDNVGKVRNTGFEASLGGFIIRKKDLSFNITGRIAYNKTEVVKLSDAIKLQTEQNLNSGIEVSNLLYEGYSPNSIWAVKSVGVDPSTGDEMFLTKEGELTNTWSSKDKVYCGVADPKFRGNISSLVSYKNLSLNLSFAYHWGGQQYNNTLIDKVEVTESQLGTNLDRRVLSARWLQPGDVTFFKGIGKNRTRASSRFVMDDNVFQLQTASLKYKFSTKYLKEKWNIQSANISMNMNDIFYLSSIKRERGTNYPFARRVSFTFSVMF